MEQRPPNVTVGASTMSAEETLVLHNNYSAGERLRFLKSLEKGGSVGGVRRPFPKEASKCDVHTDGDGERLSRNAADLWRNITERGRG